MPNKENLDDFWSIDKLLPKKRTYMSPFSTNGKTVSFTVGEGDSDNTAADRRINFDSFSFSKDNCPKPTERTYEPTYNQLIKRVSITPAPDKFDFYDTFRKAALVYYEYKCPKCDFQAFYSYKPQYSQMTTEQKKYYFYWRDELRHKRYIKTDYSYVYLYVYEILNLPDKIYAKEGLDLLLDVWISYRKELPRLDVNMSSWVCDYCLVYGLPCPSDAIKPIIFDVLNVSSFKEFYISKDPMAGENCVDALLAYLSDYDWRKGRYSGGDHSLEYRMHLNNAMGFVLSKLLSSESINKSELATVSRSAFAGSLCTHTVKCNLKIEYYPLSEIPEVRETVTSALKYTENRLRGMLGAKSRLSVKGLADDIKLIIDCYFDRVIKKIREKTDSELVPEYERLYDAPARDSGMSAADIEKSSWEVTARLVEDLYHDEPSYIYSPDGSLAYDGKDSEERKNTEGSVQIESAYYGLDSISIDFIYSLCIGDVNKARMMISEQGLSADLIVDKINEAFMDNYGDVIIEPSDTFYNVIEEYKEEILKWTQK